MTNATLLYEPHRPLPFLGREQILSRLSGIVQSSLEEEAQCIILHGEAGIGKSRLASELGKKIRERGFTVLHGRAFENQQAADVITQLVEDATRSQKARTILSSLDPSTLAVLGKFSAESSSRAAAPALKTDAALSLLFNRLVRSTPLVLVIDDAQWMSEESFSSLERIATSVGAGAFSLLLLVRTEALQKISDRAARFGIELSIETLAPLDGHDLKTFVHDNLGSGDANDFSEWLARSTDGVPLYVTELLRGLVSTGMLRHSGESWHAENYTGFLPRTPQLSAILRNRLATLSSGERSALAIAAVGETFPLALLQKFSSQEIISALLDHSILTSNGEGLLRFRHNYIYKAALELFSASERSETERHLLLLTIANNIRLDTPQLLETHSTFLGQQFSADRLVAYCREAIEKSKNFLSKLSYYKLASELDPANDTLMVNYAKHLITLYDFSGAIEILKRRDSGTDRSDDVRLLLAQAYTQQGMQDEAQEILSSLHDRKSFRARYTEALLTQLRGNMREAGERFKELEEEAKEYAPSGEERRNILRGIATAAMLRGDYEEAKRYHERMLEDAHAAGDLGAIPSARANLAVAHLLSGEISSAKQLFQETIPDFASFGNKREEMLALLNVGYCNWIEYTLEDALTIFNYLLDYYRSSHNDYDLSFLLVLRGFTLLDLERVIEAEENAYESKSLLEKGKFQHITIECDTLMAHLDLNKGNLTEALLRSDDAIAQAIAHGDTSKTAPLEEIRACSLARLGRWGEAEEQFESACRKASGLDLWTHAAMLHSYCLALGEHMAKSSAEKKNEIILRVEKLFTGAIALYERMSLPQRLQLFLNEAEHLFGSEFVKKNYSGSPAIFSDVTPETSSSSPRARVSAFGKFRAFRAGSPLEVPKREWGSLKPRKLVALIIATELSEKNPTREYLESILWPDLEPEKSANNFHVALAAARKALGTEFALYQNGSYRFNRELSSADVLEFITLTDEAHQSDEDGKLHHASECYARATRLYTGDFCEGFYDEWCDQTRDKLREIQRNALVRLAELSLGRLDTNAALDAAERLLALDALDESGHVVAIRSHLAVENRSGAKKHYEKCVEIYKRELDEDPPRSVKQLMEKV